MDYKEGRHFVLHLLKFVYQISGKLFPADMQKLLDEFPIDEESKFSHNITKCIMVFVKEYLDFGADIPSIYSQEFQEALNSVTLHESLLEFLGYYSLKCVSDTTSHPESPSIFLASVTKFFANIKHIKHADMCEYWEELDHAAAKIVVRDLEMFKGKCKSLRDPFFKIDMASEREIIKALLNYVFCLYSAPSQMKLKHEVGLKFVLTSNIEMALRITVNHHSERYSVLRDYSPIHIYCRNLSIKGFSDEGFLEYCVCCAREAVAEYTVEDKMEAPMNALDNLVKILQRAKEDGKYKSFDQMEEAALTLIRTNSERIKHMRERSANSCLKRKLATVEDVTSSDDKSKKEVR